LTLSDAGQCLWPEPVALFAGRGDSAWRLRDVQPDDLFNV